MADNIDYNIRLFAIIIPIPIKAGYV